MAVPSEKSLRIEAMLYQALGKDRQDCILRNECVGCGLLASIFRDDLARREFEISGLCQECQDWAFQEPEEE